MEDKTFPLNTGAHIPALGLGTWQSAPGAVANAVTYALTHGYRHIDAAYCYGNEDEVGTGIAAALASGTISRADIFVTTKLWCTYHTRIDEALGKSLASLGLDYVDAYLMHWPVAMNPHGNHEKFPKLADGRRDLVEGRRHMDTWVEMQGLLATGKVRAIGVCNYSAKYLAALLADPRVTVVPAINQVENHPYLPQAEVVDLCREKGIHVTAYSPLGSTGSPLMALEEVKGVAEKHGVPPATVLLSYHVANGRSVLAKSVTPARIEQNRHIIQLDKDDLKALDKISENGVKRYVYPEFGVNFGFPDKNEGIVMA